MRHDGSFPMQSYLNKKMIPGRCRLEFWEEGAGVSNARLTPGQLFHESALWQRDIIDFGPWKPVDTDPAGYRWADRIWRSQKAYGNRKVIICGPCGSAMDVAWELSRQGCLETWDSVVAVSQQTGRGQRHRSWTSPVGNLYAAWCWPGPEMLANRDWEGLLPLIAGYIAADVLIVKGLRACIKWPNDLLVNGRKIGGILLEQKAGRIMVGIGINLDSHPGDHLLRDEFAVPATSLANEAVSATPLSLWLDLIAAGEKKFNQIVESMTPAEWTKIFNQRLAWIGKRVRIQSADSDAFEAIVSGVAEDGGLKLQSGSLTNTLYSGSLVLV